MASCPGSSKNQFFFINCIYTKPVRLYVALPESDIVTGQGVVTVLFFQCLFFPESLKDIFKQGQIFAPLIDTLQIFSELGGLVITRSSMHSILRKSIVKHVIDGSIAFGWY